MEIKFTVIVPIYNTERYLEKCINSVIDQKYNNYELILIDNGSTDNSFEHISKYIPNPKVHIIRLKENHGISGARNYGIDVSTGDYILFLDSDDFYIKDNFFDELNKHLQKYGSDLVFFQTRKYIDDKGYFGPIKLEFDDSKINGKSKLEIMQYLSKNDLYNATSWNKAYKRKIIIDNSFYFLDGIRGEDVEWYNRVIVKMDSISAIGSVCHAYRVRNNSTSHTGWNLKCWQDIYDFLSADLDNFNLNKEIDCIRMSFYTSYFYILLGMTCKFPNKNELIKKLKKINNYQKIHIGKKNKICYAITFLLAYNIGSKIIYKFLNRGR